MCDCTIIRATRIGDRERMRRTCEPFGQNSLKLVLEFSAKIQLFESRADNSRLPSASGSGSQKALNWGNSIDG
jgi:hypothetical protein